MLEAVIKPNDAVILQTVSKLGQNTCVSEVYKKLGPAFSEKAILDACDRMHLRGHLNRSKSASEPKQGGKKKKLYTITPQGHEALRFAKTVYTLEPVG